MNPWNEKELEEIARLRKAGHDDSYIRGQMKVLRKSNNVPIVSERNEPMATKRKAKKKASKKKVTAKKKAASKKATRKKSGTPGRKKGTFLIGSKITAVKNMDEYFYKGYPRFKAYELLVKQGPMEIDTFVDKVEKIDGVKTRAQALGIMTKLVEKECARVSGKGAAEAA